MAVTVDDIPPDQIVFVATGNNAANRCFHTDMDCESVKGPDRVREVRRGDRPDLRQCKRCSGEWRGNQWQEQSHPHDLLEEMTPEEAGLSPMLRDREVGGS